MNIVFLDSDSLPRTIARPAWVSSWIDRPSTRADEWVQVASHADALITNKVRIAHAVLGWWCRPATVSTLTAAAST
jgi:hypothetical protein